MDRGEGEASSYPAGISTVPPSTEGGGEEEEEEDDGTFSSTRDRGVVFVQRHGVSAAYGLVGIKLRVPGIPPVIASRGATPTIAFLARVTA